MRSESFLLSEAQRIVESAISTYSEIQGNIIVLFSGGYDSMIVAHLCSRLCLPLPLTVRAIGTQLAADGWEDYVHSVANRYGWNFEIYQNVKGFEQFVETVHELGCPRTKAMHTFVFQKLKERGFDALHTANKRHGYVHDKTLFLSGMRRAESIERRRSEEVQRIGKSNKIFAAPIVDWSDEECNRYRSLHGLPTNPFYATVKGSGDCQCNWGNFITLGTLAQHSPRLSAGNVGLIDSISIDKHGFGWDGRSRDQLPLFEIDYDEDEARLDSPFLCQNCSRLAAVPKPTTEQLQSN